MRTLHSPRLAGAVAAAIVVSAVAVIAQPFTRWHTVNEATPLRLVPADERPPADSRVEVEEHDGHRHVHANGVPEHPVGRFPNRGNPHSIREQRYRFRLPLDPRIADEPTPLANPSAWGPPGRPFGVAVNGVPFDPGAAEWWRGWRGGGWTYEPLGGAVRLGVDENHAHVQPGGQYHYHGLPTGLMKRLDCNPGAHSPLIGWAADGFPIYALYGHADADDSSSEIVELKTSFRLKQGRRPGGDRGPGGAYDGAFVEDYEYAAGSGDLDECNGRRCVTPDFPDGAYAYFLTRDWPVIPRAFRGEPVSLRQ